MPREVTALIRDLRAGEAGVVDHVFPVVYDELRAIAHRHLIRERSGHTLSTTALVHEAYERLVDQTRVEWQDRAHFCAVAAQAMRRILIDYARRRQAKKRGGKQQPLSLDEVRVGVDEQATMLLSLDQALTRLAALNDRLARVVELRFFGGLTEEEAAEVLGVSTRTVRRDWVKAKAWLFKELYPDEV
jgi:RNA polymerase sigma factor (TIGR02999 family)